MITITSGSMGGSGRSPPPCLVLPSLLFSSQATEHADCNNLFIDNPVNYRPPRNSKGASLHEAFLSLSCTSHPNNLGFFDALLGPPPIITLLNVIPRQLKAEELLKFKRLRSPFPLLGHSKEVTSSSPLPLSWHQKAIQRSSGNLVFLDGDTANRIAAGSGLVSASTEFVSPQARTRSKPQLWKGL